MCVSYKNFLKLIFEKNLTDLRNATGILSFIVTRLTLDEDVCKAVFKYVFILKEYVANHIVEYKPDEVCEDRRTVICLD